MLVLAFITMSAMALRPGDRAAEPATPLAVEQVEPAEPEPDPVEAPAAEEPPGVGEWRALPPAPIDGRHSALTLVFGRGMLLWGGVDEAGEVRRDGAVYRVDAQEWYPLTEAPLALVSARGVGLWSSPCTVEPCAGGVIVLGDDEQTGEATALRVDLRRRESTWRVLQAPPDGAWLWHTAIWDGREVLVLEDSARSGAAARLIGYDPRADAWTERPSGPIAGWSGSRSARAGPFVHMTGLLPGLSRTAIATYDGQGWTDPHPAPVEGHWHPEIVPSPSGGPLLIAGNHHTEGPRAFVWSSALGWSTLPELPPSHLRVEQHLARTGGRIIAWSGDELGLGLVLPRPDADRWELMAPAPGPGRRDAAVAWTGTRLVVWGGRAGEEVLEDGAAFRLP